MPRGHFVGTLVGQRWNLKPRERKSPRQDGKARAQLWNRSPGDATSLAHPGTLFPAPLVPRPGFRLLLRPDLRTVLSCIAICTPGQPDPWYSLSFVSTGTLCPLNPQGHPLEFLVGHSYTLHLPAS